MSTLFIATRSPKSTLQFETILKLAQKGDCVILAQDAVFSVKTNPSELDSASKRGVTICAVKADLEARGIGVPPYVHPIDYAGFVDLLAEHARTYS
jgi:tRNA 2-thiouridine synthesizing protein B